MIVVDSKSEVADLHRACVEIAGELPRHHQTRLQEIGERLIFDGKAQEARCLVGCGKWSRQKRRQLQREQVQSAVTYLKTVGLIGTWEWLFVRWVVVPFLKRLLFGEQS